MWLQIYGTLIFLIPPAPRDRELGTIPPADRHQQIRSFGTAGKWELAPSQGPGKVVEIYFNVRAGRTLPM